MNEEDLNRRTLKSEPCEQLIIEEKLSKVNGELVIKRYNKGNLLGKGGFAKVHELINLETKKIYAGKIIMKSSLSKSRAKQKVKKNNHFGDKIKIHKSLHHHHIVNFEHVFEDHENVYILLELCSNQTLNEILKRRKKIYELEVQYFVYQIISALKYLHNVKVIHRDLKLGNVFLNEKLEVKIGDFGLATKLEFDGEKKRTICGTPNYIAPEVLDGKIGHSFEVDIWSLGVIIYTLLIGKPPYETPDVKTTYKKIKLNNYSFPEQHPISDQAKNLISRILVLDPFKRPTLDEILVHPFFNHVGGIPKSLPLSCLACPPSFSWLKKYTQPDLLGSGVYMKNDNFSSSSNDFLLSPKDGFDRTITKSPSNIPLRSQPPSRNKESGVFPSLQSPSSFAIQSLPNLNKIGKKEEGGKIEAVGWKDGGGRREEGVRIEEGGMRKEGEVRMEEITGRKEEGIKSEERWRREVGEVSVKKWVDYSNKYGLGYLLTNGATGVFFNDNTKIVLEPKGSHFEYYEKAAGDRQDILSTYSLRDYPNILQKKITLLMHFKNYLEGIEKNAAFSDFNNAITSEEFSQRERGLSVFVKKWMKTKHAIIFRLSNKIVHVIFTDKTELILSSEFKTINYLNKRGERNTFPLHMALEASNPELSKRLKYTREILSHMLNSNANQPVHHSNQQEGDN